MLNVDVFICLNIPECSKSQYLKFLRRNFSKICSDQFQAVLTSRFPHSPSHPHTHPTGLTLVEQTAQKPQTQSACNEACSNM